MMLRAIAVLSSSRPAILEAVDAAVLPNGGGPRSSSPGGLFKRSFISCSSSSSSSSSSSAVSRGHGYIPKLEPFSRTKFERALKDPPLIEKSKNELAEYCSVLGGDEAYNCWRAYFEEPFSKTKFERALKDPPLIEKSKNELAEYCSVLVGDEAYSCWRAYFELKELESAKEDVERLILQAGGVKSLVGCLHGIAEIHKVGKEAISKKMAATKNVDLKFQHVQYGLPKLEEEIEEERSRMPDSLFGLNTKKLVSVRTNFFGLVVPNPTSII